jgi:hypothetical protein
MASAPPQGFDPGLIGTLNQIDDEESQRSSFDTSLLNENNHLLYTLLKQMEIVTDEENIDGGKLP